MVSAHELCIRSEMKTYMFSPDDLDDVRNTIENLQRFTMKVQFVLDTRADSDQITMFSKEEA
ncbi:MAG: hypothetical protein EBV86_01045 [Marivivens sp.]|nr:hypothetical protein [Marivivens sp.]